MPLISFIQSALLALLIALVINGVIKLFMSSIGITSKKTGSGSFIDLAATTSLVVLWGVMLESFLSFGIIGRHLVLYVILIISIGCLPLWLYYNILLLVNSYKPWKKGLIFYDHVNAENTAKKVYLNIVLGSAHYFAMGMITGLLLGITVTPLQVYRYLLVPVQTTSFIGIFFDMLITFFIVAICTVVALVFSFSGHLQSASEKGHSLINSVGLIVLFLIYTNSALKEIGIGYVPDLVASVVREDYLEYVRSGSIQEAFIQMLSLGEGIGLLLFLSGGLLSVISRMFASVSINFNSNLVDLFSGMIDQSSGLVLNRRLQKASELLQVLLPVVSLICAYSHLYYSANKFQSYFIHIVIILGAIIAMVKIFLWTHSIPAKYSGEAAENE